MTGHVCIYREQLIWSNWTRTGPLAERLARRIPLCEICETERPLRKPRPPVLREIRAEVLEAPPLADATGRTVAKVLVKFGEDREGFLPMRGSLTELSRRGIPASLAEQWLDFFLRAGWITVIWAPGPPSRLNAVTLLRPELLRELAHPGEEALLRSTLQSAKTRVEPLAHPKATEIAALLESPEGKRFSPLLIQALAAVAVHVESGEVLAERVFSTRYLGKSKALASVRNRLERILGPLPGLGIREGASLTLVGGDGVLRLPDREIGLRPFAPFLGLPREIVENLEGIAFPPGGLFVVENLTVFEACCRGEVAAAQDCLIAWSAGYPGRSVRKLIELAHAAGARLRIWADLDLDGIRIARLIDSWFPPGAEFHLMSPHDVQTAPSRHRLNSKNSSALRRELKERPKALLAGTLETLIATDSWVEQEAFLGGPEAPSLLSR